MDLAKHITMLREFQMLIWACPSKDLVQATIATSVN